MAGKVSVVIEQDEHGCYAWRPELKGCQSQGSTVEEALTDIRAAIELYLETLTDGERSAALSNVPTAPELARRKRLLARALRISAGKPPSPVPFPSSEEMQREDRDR